MTLTDIVNIVLLHLGYKDYMTVPKEIRDSFLEYANEAQNEIARAIYLKAEENILPENGIFSLSELSRSCRQVLAVQQLGHEVRFLVGKEDRIIALPYATPAIITYLCYPKPLEWLYEEPELPSYTHGLIANYIIGMVLKGSRPDKDTPNIHLSMYEAAIRTLKKKEQVCRIILRPERNSEEP